MAQAKAGDTVHIHYTGTLTDGTEFDSSRDRGPLTFTLGSGQVIAGLDAHLTGMEVGTTSTVTIPVDKAYDPVNPDNVQAIPRNALPDDIEPQVGMQLQADAGGGQIVAVRIVEVTDDQVRLDANHPLAGQDLTFEVEFLKVD
ncbi:FKBP-type peptidyl-prolyl cis-trans isomerase [Halovulum sp. GXIMD14793]